MHCSLHPAVLSRELPTVLLHAAPCFKLPTLYRGSAAEGPGRLDMRITCRVLKLAKLSRPTVAQANILSWRFGLTGTTVCPCAFLQPCGCTAAYWLREGCEEAVKLG